MDTATKTGKDAAKTASKTLVQKTAEATGDLTWNKKTGKITSAGKIKSNKRRWKNKTQEIYIPTRKKTANNGWLKIIIELYKNGIPKN